MIGRAWGAALKAKEPPRRTIKIPAPLAAPGDRVAVRNRRRRDHAWEQAVVLDVSFHTASSTLGICAATEPFWPGRWSYHVVLERRIPRGSPFDIKLATGRHRSITLRVGDEDITRASGNSG